MALCDRTRIVYLKLKLPTTDCVPYICHSRMSGKSAVGRVIRLQDARPCSCLSCWLLRNVQTGSGADTTSCAGGTVSLEIRRSGPSPDVMRRLRICVAIPPLPHTQEDNLFLRYCDAV
jgi:hypothetical protein